MNRPLRDFRFQGKSVLLSGLLGLLLLVASPLGAWANNANPCPRPTEGSEVRQPSDIYSRNGVIDLTLLYYTEIDFRGRTLFCFVTPDGHESPTLHVNPGDTIDLTVKNRVPPAGGGGGEIVSGTADACGDSVMTISSVNVHFHGTNTSPRCHSDEVVHTLINSGQSFRYQLKIPADEPPGMYWYHPHVHGIAESAVRGGASGAIEVEGIANLQPAVAGLPQRFLVIRDQALAYPPNKTSAGQPVPFWDVSLNYVPVAFPTYVPEIIKMKSGAQEFWRVVNASADTVMDLQLQYDGVAQPLEIAALDGVPTGSQDGKHKGTLITQSDIMIPPAGRAEFIVTGPKSSVQKAVFWTRHIDTGPLGDVDTARPLAAIEQTKDAKKIPPSLAPIAGEAGGQRFAGLSDAMVTAHRHLYFSEVMRRAPGGGSVKFFITVKGQTPTQYYADEPPAIVTTRGAVEDWTIENQSQEVHEFHMHQIHFEVLAINGVAVPPSKRQFYDTHQVDYWTGSGPYPNIKVRMDFRGAVVGEFVYHCHILGHEDAGMMANMVVLPRTSIPRAALARDSHSAASQPARSARRTIARL